MNEERAGGPCRSLHKVVEAIIEGRSRLGPSEKATGLAKCMSIRSVLTTNFSYT